MLYLILAIISSVMVSTVIRLSEKHVDNPMAMFAANYLVCLMMAYYYMDGAPVYAREPGMSYALALGLVNGLLYLGGFILLQWNIKKNGMVLSSTFMKLGVLVPTLMAVVVFHEQPKLMQIVGFLIAIGAIVLIHFDKDSDGSAEQDSGMDPAAEAGAGQKGNKIWLFVLLLVGGFTDSLANIYDKTGSAAVKEQFLFFTFIAAMGVSIILTMYNRKGAGKKDVISGLILGIPNYFSARFLLLAVGEIPAVVTYPVYSTATIVGLSLIGVCIFREKISRRKQIALGMIVAALVLLNL